jgi:hypothetical protein
MMSTVTAIPPREKTRDADDRAAVRAALAAVAKAEGAVEEHKAAVERARSLVAECEAALEKSRADVEKAKRAEAERLAASARSAGPRSKSDGLRVARTAELEAVDELDAACAALISLESEELAKQDVARAAAELVKSINLYVTKPVELALERAREARMTYLLSQQIVWALLLPPKDVVDPKFSEEVRAPLQSLINEANRLFSAGLAVSESELAQISSAKNSFAAFYAALRTNADAPMPALPGEGS